MKISRTTRIALLLVLLVIPAMTVGAFLLLQRGRDQSHSASTSLPDLEYLKAVNRVGPPQDPELLFLLMTQYSTAIGKVRVWNFSLLASTKYEMAADLIESAEAKSPGSEPLKRARRFAYLKLIEKNQNTDPFKFIIYSAQVGEQTSANQSGQMTERTL